MLALYFAIICRWQLSSSEKLLVGKENSSIYFRDLTDLDIFYTDIVFHFLWQMPVYLVGYAKCMLYSEQSTVLLTHFENLDFISNIFQETRFLSLDGPTNYLYLFKKHQHFRDQGNVRHPTSKLLKCDLVQTFNTFWNYSLRTFAAGKASLVLLLILSAFKLIN